MDNSNFKPSHYPNNNNTELAAEEEEDDDDFAMFYQMANSPSRSSSENISSPDFYERPRSKSVMYENINNLLPPDQYYLHHMQLQGHHNSNHKQHQQHHNLYQRRSPSPSRKSLGNLPIIKTMLKIDESNTITSGGSSGNINSSVSPRRPSLCPMKLDDMDDDNYNSPRHSNNELEKNDTNCDTQYTNELCHVRSFKLTEKGMVNQGDCLVSRSTGNIHYSANEKRTERLKGDNSISSIDTAPQVKIQILGANGVGKTTLASQFMTSEQICTRMYSVNEETEKLFSLRIDGQEWNILLHDTINANKGHELQVELLDKMDGYLVLYAIDDLASFEYSKQVLNDIINKVGLDSLVYLVGNKADLERSREVKMKVSKNVAKVHYCKFFEISTAFDHKVDDLLCQLIIEINKNKASAKSDDSTENSTQKSVHYRRRESQLVSTGRALGRLLKKTFGAKSCEAIP